MSNAPEQTLVDLAHEWDRAMMRNDVREIGLFMSDDWFIVGSDGGMTDKATFLAQIESGDLIHDVMESQDIVVRLLPGDAALLLARGVSGGRYRGRAFREYELSSNVFVKKGATWRCVFTHLSALVEGRNA